MHRQLFLLFIFIAPFCYSQEDCEANVREAYNLVSSGKYEAAQELLHKALAIDSTGGCGTLSAGTVQNELGYIEVRLGNIEEARVFLNKSIELEPKNPLPRLSLANTYVMERNAQGAIDNLKTLIEEIPGYAPAHFQLGSILESLGMKDEAMLEYRKAKAFNKGKNTLPKGVVNALEEKLKTEKN